MAEEGIRSKVRRQEKYHMHIQYTKHLPSLHCLQLPGQLAVRLQACQNAAPPSDPTHPTPSPSSTATTPTPSSHSSSLLRWLHRLQFKMGQIELQSSAATQFYSVWFVSVKSELSGEKGVLECKCKSVVCVRLYGVAVGLWGFWGVQRVLIWLKWEYFRV